MHSYATDANDRNKVPVYLAVLAVACALLLDYALKKFGLQVPWWIDAPSVMGFYGILHWLFDKHLWRVKIGKLSLSSIPDVGGTWVGIAESDYQNGHKTDVVIHIRQTWLRLQVRLHTEGSSSCSTMASLNTSESAESGLKYEYMNEPATLGVQTMQTHRGMASLRLSPNGNTLEGGYYTGRDRRNIGHIRAQRVSHEIIEREQALSLRDEQQLTNSSVVSKT